ncbi:MAG: tRNA-dihydrouridine synthase family protein [Nanoarchaeota archaeon]
MLPKFSSKVFLAPMSGVSDAAFRLICREMGAGLVVKEFVNIHAVIARSKDITKFVAFSPQEKPHAVQLFGSDLNALKNAVKIVEPYFDIIDYNLGCPAGHVTKQMACSALLQHADVTRKIFRTMRKATRKPLSVKIRAGVKKPDRWKIIAKIAEEEGIEMITFHPRTVKQGYSGRADWSLIKELKKLVKIPVVGNGDITSPEEAVRMFKETGCDHVMVGRAAASNPYIFTQINDYLQKGKYKQISSKERIGLFFRYLKYAQKFPSSIELSNMKTQAMAFSKSCPESSKLRKSIAGVKTIGQVEQVMKEFYAQL